MKKLTSFFAVLLLLASTSTFAQYQFNKESFVSKAKELFELAKKRFPGETKSEKLDAGEGYKMAYSTGKRFEEAFFTRLVVDNDDLTGLETRFLIGKNKEDALKAMMEMVELLKTAHPAKYTSRNTFLW